MNYEELIQSSPFPSAKEAQRLYIRAIKGDEREKWKFVLSQIPWIKSVIFRFFNTRIMGDYDEMISDGIMSLHKTISQKTIKTTLPPLWGFRKIAKLRIFKDIQEGVSKRNSQIELKRNQDGSWKTPWHHSFNTDNEDDQVSTRKHLHDKDMLSPAEEMEQKDLADECRKVLAHAAKGENRTGIRMRRFVGKVKDDGYIDFRAMGVSRQNVNLINQGLRRSLYVRYPALREIFKEPR